jgi:hypothetical protein
MVASQICSRVGSVRLKTPSRRSPA